MSAKQIYRQQSLHIYNGHLKDFLENVHPHTRIDGFHMQFL